MQAPASASPFWSSKYDYNPGVGSNQLYQCPLTDFLLNARFLSVKVVSSALPSIVLTNKTKVLSPSPLRNLVISYLLTKWLQALPVLSHSMRAQLQHPSIGTTVLHSGAIIPVGSSGDISRSLLMQSPLSSPKLASKPSPDDTIDVSNTSTVTIRFSTVKLSCNLLRILINLSHSVESVLTGKMESLNVTLG